tara:strand:+ start:296 stop:670 length:375 start_codon:yes stop_codon:yes gene_type:complete
MSDKKELLEEFQFADGKDRANKENQINRAKELESLLGIQDMNPYRTLNKKIFAENLGSMSISQMTELAQRVGISGMEMSSRPSLKKALVKSFDIYLRQHNVSVAGPPTPVAENVSDEVKKLFEL